MGEVTTKPPSGWGCRTGEVRRSEEGYRLHSLVREFLREKLAETEEETAGNAQEVRLKCSNVMNDFLIQYNRKGRYLKAISLGEQSLKICKSELGDRHPSTATRLNNLAALYESMGQYDRALPLLESVVSLFEELLGHDHPNTKVVQGNLRVLREKM